MDRNHNGIEELSRVVEQVFVRRELRPTKSEETAVSDIELPLLDDVAVRPIREWPTTRTSRFDWRIPEHHLNRRRDHAVAHEQVDLRHELAGIEIRFLRRPDRQLVLD